MSFQKNIEVDLVENNILNDSQAIYDSHELSLLKEGLKRSYKERFLFATTLYKVQQTFKKNEDYSQARHPFKIIKWTFSMKKY